MVGVEEVGVEERWRWCNSRISNDSGGERVMVVVKGGGWWGFFQWEIASSEDQRFDTVSYPRMGSTSNCLMMGNEEKLVVVEIDERKNCHS
ncbi:hypothetical protein RHMOL_Rhmol13G0028300 [Rhododendron molle]|uniref:Uncharacterized protein n=1 Tax=Rhododendron molle TaxID=49168 RepID=A0ACC0L2I4_RHOML|nr:hypothetical protein RHMOL_Rhmol13G0028300 [Rhododendron molle]